MKVAVSIRVLFSVCMFALAGMAACLGGWTMAQAVVQYHLAGRLERAVAMDRLWFTAADKLAVERPLTGDRLLEDRPADAATLKTLAAARRETDRAISLVEQMIEALYYKGAPQQLALIRSTRQNLDEWRAKVTAMMALPKAEREPDIFSRYVNALNAMLEGLDRALDLGDVAASQQDGVTMDLIALTRQAWSVRRVMGARTVPLMARLNGAIPMDAAAIEQQAQFDGTLATGWSLIDALSRRLQGQPSVIETVARAHAAFNDHDALCHRIIAAGRDGARYPVSALELSGSIVRNAPVLESIRDAALAAAQTRVTANRETALLRVLASGAAVCLIIAATFGVLLLLKHRIVTPVLALTDVIDRLARRDYEVEIPARSEKGEIGRMAAAIETLRQGAVAAARNEAHIVHLANHDALTGLANRMLLHNRIEQALAGVGQGQLCALLCLDLDRFKAVNDTFGHPVGDMLLRVVADRLASCVQKGDTVSRLGGDEFVVLLAAIQQADHASIVAQRIVRTLNERFELDGHTVSVGASVGIALAPQDATSAISLLKSADTALYRAKMENKGGYRYFKPDMDAFLQARAVLERDLRDAVQNGAFELLYQPQFVLAADRLRGFEALLRWRHPVRGLVEPEEFIALAEETGLIVPIGAWVLRIACAEAMSWASHLTLAVNLSAVQIKHQDIVETVSEALAGAGLPAHRLDVEITETALLNDCGPALGALRALHDMGASISMDDFGTGYSSLCYLRCFPFDRIKIARSFISDISEREDARAIVRAMVALGRNLGMKTLAEGVETPHQLEFLRSEACDEAQGFLFSKPLPAEAARLLARSFPCGGGMTERDSRPKHEPAAT